MRGNTHWLSLMRLRVGLAIRNVTRQKQRTAFTLGAIAFGVAALIVTGGFVQDIYRQLAEAIIHSQSGHLQVARRGYFELGARNPSNYLGEPASLRALLQPVEAQVAQSMGRLSSSGILSNGRREFPVMVEAVESHKEQKLGVSLRFVEGAALREGDRFGVSLGVGVARTLQVKVGDTVTLLVNTPDGALNTLDLKVTGIFQSFFKEYDARIIRMQLPDMQYLLGTQGVHYLVVQLREGIDARWTIDTLRAQEGGDSYEFKAWYELSDFYDKTVQLYDRQFGAVRIVIFLMVMLSVVNAVNMSVYERLGEMGTMRALGDTSRNVFALIVTEVLLLGVLGAATGLLLGIGAAKLISWIGIPMPPPPNSDLPYVARIQIDVLGCATACVTGFLAAVTASIRPARVAARMPICTALRQAI